MLIFLLTVAGEFTITLSDNKTYMAGTTCMFGKENFWWLLSATPEIDPATKAAAEAHFAGLGFKAPVAVKGTDPVILKKFLISVC